MQEAFQAAQAGQQGPNLPTLDFSLKPGETVNLKLADKVNSNSNFLQQNSSHHTLQHAGE